MIAPLLLSALPLVAPQGDEPTGQATVYRLDHIETLAGDALENASIVVRDGVIERIGQAVIVPDNARVIDLRGSGSVAMPPFVLGQSSSILPGDSRGSGGNGRYVAAGVYRADEDVLGELREAGVLLMALVPPGTGIPGRTSVLRSDASDLMEDALVRDLHLTMTIDMSKSSKDLLRKAFESAEQAIEKEEKARADWQKARKEWEEKQKAAAEAAKKKEGESKGGKSADEPKKDEGKEPPKEFTAPRIDPNIQPLVDLIRKERVAQIWISSPGEWLHWLDVVGEREFAWEVVLDHGSSTNLHEVADAIAGTGVRVYLPSRIPVLPSTQLRTNLAAELVSAGVEKLVLLPSSTRSMNSITSWRVGLGDLVREGLDRQTALRAVSVEPAASMGQEELIAPLEAGGPATFVILEGDPLNPLAEVSHLIAAGEVVYDRAKEDKEN